MTHRYKTASSQRGAKPLFVQKDGGKANFAATDPAGSEASLPILLNFTGFNRAF
jgi:hypothetical protein